MASADFPPGCPGRTSPGKNALLPGTTAAFTSTTEPMDYAVLCQLIRRVGLLCDSCPSARRLFCRALPASVVAELLGTSSLVPVSRVDGIRSCRHSGSEISTVSYPSAVGFK